MTPEQALSIIEQALVSKQGLSLRDMSALLVAWNTLVDLVGKPPEVKIPQMPKADLPVEDGK